MRGSAPARIDEKGRLKVPTLFRGEIQDHRGPDVFVTSIKGDCVRIYPMAVWLEVERKLSAMPPNHPSRIRFLAAVNYYGQPGELDAQGRVVIPAHLRTSAFIVGDVRVFGHHPRHHGSLHFHHPCHVCLLGFIHARHVHAAHVWHFVVSGLTALRRQWRRSHRHRF